MRLKEFSKAGHTPSLVSAFLHFDVSFMVWVILGSLGVYIAQDYHLSAAEKAFMAAVPTLGGSFFRIILGLLTDRFGPRRVGTFSMFFVLFPLLMGWLFVNSYSSILLIAPLLGVAGASFAVALPMASRWYPPEYQGLAMGIAGAGNSGTVLANLFAPRIAEMWGWHAVFGLIMIPVLLVALAFAFLAKDAPNRPPAPTLKDYARLLGKGDLWAFCLLYSVTFGGFVGLSTFLPIFFFDQYRLGKVDAGNFAALCVFAGSLFRPIGGYLSDRLGGIKMLLALYSLIAVLFLVMSSLPAFAVATLALFIVMASLGMGNGAVFQLVPQRFRAEIGIVTGLVGAAGGLGGFFLPTVLGFFKDALGTYAVGFGAFALLALVAIGLLLLVRGKWLSGWAAPHQTLEKSAPVAPTMVADFAE
ncbi:MAG TPA: nitrate/nitrite transporter [Chloroflexia bacterium]|nr:nitrate/nitrite transporter [Chloroflexia bacterium]